MSEVVKFSSLFLGATLMVGAGIWYKRSNMAAWLKGSIAVAVVIAGSLILRAAVQYTSGVTP